MKRILFSISLVTHFVYAQNSFTNLSELQSVYYKNQNTCTANEQQNLIKTYIEVDSLNENVLEYINYLRSLVNNNKLSLDSTACSYAKSYAKIMSESGIFQHSDIQNTPYLCENILYIDMHIKSVRLQSLPTRIVSLWSNSPGHNLNLNYPAKKAGVGIAYNIIDACTIRVYAVYVTTEKTW
jgi:uncharacterized protein YkwD